MSREEVSALGSARREEVRRQYDEKERLKANPLLWLVSPQVKVNENYDNYSFYLQKLYTFYVWNTCIFEKKLLLGPGMSN